MDGPPAMLAICSPTPTPKISRYLSEERKRARGAPNNTVKGDFRFYLSRLPVPPQFTRGRIFALFFLAALSALISWHLDLALSKGDQLQLAERARVQGVRRSQTEPGHAINPTVAISSVAS